VARMPRGWQQLQVWLVLAYFRHWYAHGLLDLADCGVHGAAANGAGHRAPVRSAHRQDTVGGLHPAAQQPAHRAGFGRVHARYAHRHCREPQSIPAGALDHAGAMGYWPGWPGHSEGMWSDSANHSAAQHIILAAHQHQPTSRSPFQTVYHTQGRSVALVLCMKSATSITRCHPLVPCFCLRPEDDQWHDPLPQVSACGWRDGLLFLLLFLNQNAPQHFANHSLGQFIAEIPFTRDLEWCQALLAEIA